MGKILASLNATKNADPVSRRKVIIVLASIASLGPFSIDLYLPALPEMADSLRATDAAMQLTITAFLAGFAVGALLLAPISDAIGRRRVLIGAVLIFVGASALCALANSAEQLIFFRVLQAIGGGAAGAITRAVVRDLTSGNEAARMLSVLMLVMSIAPLIAPSVGGLILAVWGWEANFWAMAGIGSAVVLAITFTLPETLSADKAQPLRISNVVIGYAQVLSSRRAMAYSFASAFAGAAMFAYIAATPFIYIEFYGLDPQLFGLFFAANVGGAILLNWLNAKFVMRYGYQRMLVLAAIGFGLLGMALLFNTITGFGGIWGIAAAVFLVVGVAHTMGSNGLAGMMESFGHRAGSATATFAAARLGAGALATFIIGVLNDGSPWPLGAVVMGCAVLSIGSVVVALGTKS
ncbi:MAG: multidrug effflux MFS transporter [Alphaproteobacteria bacterium]